MLLLVTVAFLSNSRNTPSEPEREHGEQAEQSRLRPVTEREQGEQRERQVVLSAIPAAENPNRLPEPKPPATAQIDLQVAAIGDALILGQPWEFTEPTTTGWSPVSPESLSPMARRTLENFVVGLATSNDYEECLSCQ